jgi:DNA-binding beta-propeller fold protein YncE
VPLRAPFGVAVSSLGTVYVGYADRVCVWRVGEQGSTALTDPVLDHPFGLAVDGAGNVYIADQGHNRVVKVAHDSNALSELRLKKKTSTSSTPETTGC